jgi:outer membrane protein insertion porin family
VTLSYEDPDAPFGAEPEQLTIQEIADRIFSPQYGETLNLLDFQQGIERLNETYQANGYVLAQVVDAPQPQDGVVRLEVAEGVIEDIEVTFLDEDGLAVDEEGNPIEGRTRDFIITREFETEPGDVFNQQQIQSDLQNVFALGIFDDVRVSLDPGDDPRQVDVIVNVIEGSTGSLAAGIGFSSASGVFGSASYQQQNLGGNNQRLGAEIQLGTRELLFDVRFTDPWIAGDPYRTSYTVNAFSRRSISLIFDGGENEVELENGDRPRVQRIGGGVSFSRPLDEWLGWEGWRASTGFQYQHVTIRDSDGELTPEDEEGNDLSFSGSGRDDLFTLQLAAVRDRRDSITQPTRGSLLRVGTEQSIPFGSGSILFNRVRASYSRYFPVSFTNFSDGPEALAFNVQAGTVVGDLPPYEAFSLGGTDSVRGYDSGDLGSGRSFVQATAEYRFPIFAIIGGALFVDFGSDLGTADDVPGEPAEIRDKPGTGFGYGLGVRVQSPLGPIRVDYGINDEGDSRIHFGIGERF